jgi:hypothetical protein
MMAGPDVRALLRTSMRSSAETNNEGCALVPVDALLDADAVAVPAPLPHPESPAAKATRIVMGPRKRAPVLLELTRSPFDML